MKILYCGMDSNLGGIESFVINMYRNIDKTNIQIDFLKITDSIYYEEEFLENGSIVYKIPNRRKNPILAYWELIKFFRNHKEYEIVHHHLNSCSSIEPLILGKIFGRKTIAHSHNEYKGNRAITRILHNINKSILPFFSDVNLACSKAAGYSMFKKSNFEVINNGIDLKKYIFDEKIRDLYRREMGLENKLVIGHIGNFKYQKNHEFIINVFKELYKVNPESKLLLIGEGELLSEIKTKVVDLNIEEQVIFTGVRNDIPELLQCMDIFIFPSRYEGLGIVLIEAQAAGVKCVVAETIPQDAIVTNLVEVLSLAEGTDKWVRELLVNEEGYERKNTYAEITNYGFDSKDAAKKLENIYFSR